MSKGVDVTLKCLNKNCPAIKLQKYKNFLKVVGIKGVAERKLQGLDDIVFEDIIKEYLDKKTFKDTIYNSTVQLIFQALGFGGKQTVLKTLKETPLFSKIEAKVSTCKAEVLDVLKDLMSGDEFLEDFYMTLESLN